MFTLCYHHAKDVCRRAELREGLEQRGAGARRSATEFSLLRGSERRFLSVRALEGSARIGVFDAAL